MANTTATYWDVDGVSLQTFAWNIQTLGGTRGGVPTFRGENRQTAFRRGADWRPKTPEQRVISLAMWVQGSDDNGAAPVGRSEKSQYTENLRALRALFWRDESRQVTLTKRWLDTGDVVRSASALAEASGSMDPDMMGPYGSTLIVDLLLADPFFYGSEITATLVKDATQVVTPGGDAMTHRVTLEFNGALTNPKILNTTPNPDVWVKAGTTIGAGNKVTLDADMYTAIRSSDSANLIGAVSHSGARHWMPLAKGANSLTLTADSGSGTCAVKYRPAFW
jgi:hypothetical protein